MRPTTLHVGGTLYWVLQTRNPDTLVLKDADSTPSVAVRKNGASVGDSVTVTKRSATTGLYDCSYNPASEVEGDKFTLEESAAVTGTTTGSATYTSSFNVNVLAVERGTDSAALASGVDVTKIGGSTQSATDLKDFADTGYDPATHSVALVNTTTTNTDMRGTNDAALASTALSNVQWTNALATAIGVTNADWLNGGRLDLILDIIAADTTTDIPALIVALNNLSASEVNAEVLDVLNVDTFSELAAPPAATSSLRDKLTWVFMWLRNKSTETATQRKLYADNESTVVSTEGVTDDGTTFTKGEAV